MDSQIPIYDVSGESPVLGSIHPDEAHEAVASGQFAFPKNKPVDVIDPDGNLGTIDPSEAHEALNNGYQYATPTAINQIKHGTPLEMAKTAAEGVAEGVAGPIAPALETGLGISTPENILGRQKANPILKGVTQGVGLVGSAALGVGMAPLLEMAGKGAAEASGLAQAAGAVSELGPQLPSFAAKVGSSAVQQAAEMAILTGGDEISKQILQDPDSSAGDAIANVGLSAAMGGATGAVFTGAISPLWKATVGPKLDSLLTGVRDHLNGEGAHLPDKVAQAFDDLGMAPEAVINAALSGDVRATKLAQTAYRAQDPKFMKAFTALPKDAAEAVANSLGQPLEDFAEYSTAEAGKSARDAFLDEVDKKYEPQRKAFQAKDALDATIAVPDEEARNLGNSVIEKAISPDGPGTNSPYYKIYNDYFHRAQGVTNVGEINTIRTELGGLIDQAKRAGDTNSLKAYSTIRKTLGDFQEDIITRQAEQLEREGAEHGTAIGRDIIAKRRATNAAYKEYTETMQALGEHTGLGDFHGTGTLKSKISAKLSPEDFLKKFSPQGNVEAIDFLNTHFPETAAKVQANESQRFISPHVKTVEGEHTINYKTLNNAVEKGLKTSPEYMKYVLPGDSLQKIQSAKILQDAMGKVSGIKDSGTPAGMWDLFKGMGTTAIGAIGLLAGHGIIGSALLGELATTLGKKVPEAYRLAMLNFLSSSKPIEAEGFHATADYIHHVIKGDTMLTKSVEGLFKGGGATIPHIRIPDTASIAKLDRMVAQNQKNPETQINNNTASQLGHYAPNHQMAMSSTTTQAQAYLQNLKPKPLQLSPLDKPIPPSKAATLRYERALSIAQSPAIVLQNIKNGTLQQTDIQDLSSMYPAVYKSMQNKIMATMTNHKAEDGVIPYKTRLGLSMFMGQAMDSTMTPASIQAAQPPPPQPPPVTSQGKAKGSNKGASSMSKAADTYKTPGQEAEADRSNRK